MSYDRRAFMGYFASIGLGSTLLPGVLWARLAAGADITAASVACAAELAGLEFDEAEREMMVTGLKNQAQQITALHGIKLENSVPPALSFDPLLPGGKVPGAQRPIVRSRVPQRAVPANLEELAFLPVTELSELVRRRRVTSTQLTAMYLGRLKRYDPVLKCVVNLTEQRAMAQARAADTEIARGRYRGPLHGIPWGAKDLLAVKGTPTTWGTSPFKDQIIDEDATVVRRLDEAGAVLVAKLTLGELAMGDTWFGGMTRNPWKLDQGSSGSSAGSASATTAGLVGFAIGTETLGSIASPSTRCGATGLRPTFGRVPRTGAMALSWSMDKIGPICRSVEDCVLVLDAIRGTDGHDLTVRDAPLNWDTRLDPKTLRVGFYKSAFERDYPTKAFDQASLEVLRARGFTLTPVEIPDIPYQPMRLILTAEAAATFDELTRSGRDAEMAQQRAESWPNIFRAARFIPAVDYVNANRARTIAMRRWAELMETVDVIVAPTFSSQLLATNLTGHPAIILPNGFREDGTPVSITFVGGLYDEARLASVARAYQEATDFHGRRPTLSPQSAP
ncbi:MAG TPA: amidase [Gemmatimonadaceae bacterium]|nr:amidase [Gemmatimonadaceae bacterium]